MGTGSVDGLWRNYAYLGLIPSNRFFVCEIWALAEFITHLFSFKQPST